MPFKYWPLVRGARFRLKIGRYLRGARKRRPDLDWNEFTRVARRFTRDDMGSFPERGFLYQLAATAPMNAKVIEVGSWMGGSTSFLAAGLRGAAAKIYAVDNFHGQSSYGDDVRYFNRHFKRLGTNTTLEIFKANIGALGFAQKVEPVVSDSIAAANSLAHLKGQIDLAFIDGDHAYEACKADIVAWAPYVKRGGVMAFHDFGSSAEGVAKAIFEEIRDGRFAEVAGIAGTIIAFKM